MILTICSLVAIALGAIVLQRMAIAGLKHYIDLTENTPDAKQAKKDVDTLALLAWIILLVVLTATGIILYGVM
jgi:Ni,Fe-hydrogenase I cytochrome b subunit